MSQFGKENSYIVGAGAKDDLRTGGTWQQMKGGKEGPVERGKVDFVL